MKLTNTLFMKGLFAAAMLLLMSVEVAAQDSCTYRLRVYDAYGDGWDGSQVYIRFGNNPEQAYTHQGIVINRADSVRWFNIRVKTGDTIIVRYEAQGFFQDEVKYTLFNNADETVFGDDGTNGIDPVEGVVFRGKVKCKNCGIPVTPVIASVRTYTATVNWRPANGFQQTYTVEWDTAGFVYGRGRNRLRTTDTFAILSNLVELKKYHVFLQTVCFGGDSSSVVGPLEFLTDTATDVGITKILSPFGRCDLNIDSIKFLLTNIGGAPAQLIPYKASVNGQLLNIPFPADGLYTGVLSKDSSTTLTLKTPFNFSTPGEYTVKVWTELSGDKYKSNDTTTLVFTRPRNISTLPYSQNFEPSKDTWSVQDSLGNATWQFGTPNGPVIKGAFSGVNAWTTWKDSTYRNNEFNYLLSPCFDFSAVAANPRFMFNLNVNTEGAFDGMWLEQSVNGGQSWQVVGSRTPRSGLNWYNDSISSIRRATWGGSADSTKGWRIAQQVLNGVAGRSSVRFRFGWRTDASGNNFDGVAVDNIVISAVPSKDLAMAGFTNVSKSVCGDSILNTLTFNVFNLGSSAATAYTINYSINGGPIVSEPIATALASNGSFTYISTKPFRTTTINDYSIKAWVTQTGEEFVPNDTLTKTIRITLEKPLVINTYPYYQDFEAGTGTWSASDSLNGTWGYGLLPNNNFINTAASGTKGFRTNMTTANGTYNNNEWSYLNSPCFDFSRFTADPRVNFALNFHSERTYDGAWFEGSKDGGSTWTRVGFRGTGVNWYNDSIISPVRRGAWTGITSVGWKYAQHTLDGYAGQANCRFRFVFRADGSGNTTGGLPFGGVSVDNFWVGQPSAVDLAAAGATRFDASSCGSTKDTLTIRITNVGRDTQRTYNVFYKVDNNVTVTETANVVVAPTATISYKFLTAFNSQGSGNHTLRYWVKAVGDTVPSNDTLFIAFTNPPPIGAGISYNFDNGAAPQYWLARGTVAVGVGLHGNVATNGNIYANIWSSNKSVDLITHRHGPIRSNKDSLSYDYRFVRELSPYAAWDLTPNKDTMYLAIATDCDENWVTVDTVTAANHAQSTAYAMRKIGLGGFVGKVVRFRWRVNSSITATTGYWWELDNINYLSCPESLGLTASIRNTAQGTARGSIAVSLTQGLAPFTYKWSNNAVTDSISSLAAGTYTVTVTDGRGCTQTGTYTVVGTVGTTELASIFSKVTLAPNPTTGNTVLNVAFYKPMESRVQVLNMMGQLLYQTVGKAAEEQTFDLDMSSRPAGVYLIRVIAENRSYVVRLVKQ